MSRSKVSGTVRVVPARMQTQAPSPLAHLGVAPGGHDARQARPKQVPRSAGNASDDGACLDRLIVGRFESSGGVPIGLPRDLR